MGHIELAGFTNMKSIHNDKITIENYHQIYRYGIRVSKNDEGEKERKMERELLKIAEWLEERM